MIKRLALALALTGSAGLCMSDVIDREEQATFHDSCYKSATRDGWLPSAASAYCWCTSDIYVRLPAEEKRKIIMAGESSIPESMRRGIRECAMAFPPDEEAADSGAYYSSGTLRPPPRPLAVNDTLIYWRKLEPALWNMAEDVNREYRGQGENAVISSDLWSKVVVRLVRKRLDEHLAETSDPEKRAVYAAMIMRSFPVLAAMNSSGGAVWDRALRADTALMKMSEYADLPASERFGVMSEMLSDGDGQ